jgi:hypothetical protein
MIGPIARKIDAVEKDGIYYPLLTGQFKPFHFLIGKLGSDDRKTVLLSTAAAIGAFYAYLFASLICFFLTMWGYGDFNAKQAAMTVIALSFVLAYIAPYYSRNFPPLPDREYDFQYAALHIAPAAVLTLIAFNLMPAIDDNNEIGFFLLRVAEPSILVFLMTLFLARAHFYLKRRATWGR